MTGRHPKRKTGGGRFARLPCSVLDTEAVTSLSHAAFRILVLLAAQYHGGNNGALGLTRSQAAVNGIVSNNTLYRALAAIEERGLVEQTYTASRVPPRPTMYALTWMSVDDTTWSTSKRLPTHAYREWTPPRSMSRKPKPKAKLEVVSS